MIESGFSMNCVYKMRPRGELQGFGSSAFGIQGSRVTLEATQRLHQDGGLHGIKEWGIGTRFGRKRGVTRFGDYMLLLPA